MGVELSDELDLKRRIDARRCLKNERRRIRCKRCNKLISKERRSDAVYCSSICERRYRRECINKLRAEMRAMYRTIMAATTCACGVSLDNHTSKKGPFAWQCRKCTNRIAQQRRRDKLSNKSCICSVVS